MPTRNSRRPSKPPRKASRPKRGRNLQTEPKPPDQIQHFCTLARGPPKKTKSVEERKLGQASTSFCMESYHCLQHLTGGRGRTPTSPQGVAGSGAQRRRRERQAATCRRTLKKRSPFYFCPRRPGIRRRRAQRTQKSQRPKHCISTILLALTGFSF